MDVKNVKTIQDVLELSKKYDGESKPLTFMKYPSSPHVSDYEHRNGIRHCILTAETLLFNNVDNPLSSTVVILAGISGVVHLSGLPKFGQTVFKIGTIGDTELGGQQKGIYDAGGNNAYPVYLNNDAALADKIVFVRFSENPWSSREAVVVDACAIRIVDNDRPKPRMPEELANSVFKECVRNYYPELTGMSLADRGTALTIALREIKKAYDGFMSS